MKTYKITVIEGDGIGPEIINESLRILETVQELYEFKLDFNKVLMGGAAIEQTGHPLPDTTIEACKNSDAVLFGAIGDPKYDNDPSLKVRPEQGLLQLRKELGLFANLRPVRTYPTLLDRSPLKKEIIENTDLIIFRELINGIYFGKQDIDLKKGTAYDTCNYTRENIAAIAHLAFKTAGKRKNKVTLVDKANVLATSRLWRSVVKEISEDYPTITLETLYVDNAAMQLILNPSTFDVILTENLFGDILSDEASVLTSSIGMMPSSSIGPHTALFEPIHGSFPEAKNKGIANPLGSILSAAMMLEYLGEKQAGNIIERAVEFLIGENYLTQDLNPYFSYSTSDVGYAVDGIIQKICNEDWYYNKSNIDLGRSTII